MVEDRGVFREVFWESTPIFLEKFLHFYSFLIKIISNQPQKVQSIQKNLTPHPLEKFLDTPLNF